MQYLYAKVGTHCSRRILLMKGSPKVGTIIEWLEDDDAKLPHSPRRRGIVEKINTRSSTNKTDWLLFITLI